MRVKVAYQLLVGGSKHYVSKMPWILKVLSKFSKVILLMVILMLKILMMLFFYFIQY